MSWPEAFVYVTIAFFGLVAFISYNEKKIDKDK